MPIRRLEDTFTGTSGTIGVDELSSSALDSIRSPIQHVKPHIQPGTLQPAIAGKLLDGSTSHSGAYGTAQTQSGGDGLKYYYTDIKGSKPIKDPRIGAHFGSQRHQLSSLQILEQETATHGKNVYSVDGREWCRTINGGTTGLWGTENSGNGNALSVNTDCSGAILEITGYFNDINFIVSTSDNRVDAIKLTVNGTVSVAADTLVGGKSSAAGPLYGRYVSAGSTINGGSTLSASLGTTPTINTLKYEITNGSGEYLRMYNIELIAQDTTSTANKSKIQIPSQNVVSYGKKFSVSGTPHYDPFAFKTDGTTAWTAGNHNSTAWPVGTGSSANIDTATSLGLDAWVSTNYYKPYNGGRVVWWIDSSGTLKCSVNMMPPNARSIGNSSSLTNATAKANAAVANNTFYPTMEAGTIDNSQAESAKNFHYGEYGNGGANGNASWNDATRIVSDNGSYVMDDGLTSIFFTDCFTIYDFPPDQMMGTSLRFDNATGSGIDEWYLCFIGSGFGYEGNSDQNVNTYNSETYAQNLPYGTHIIKCKRTNNANANVGDLWVDGINIKSFGTSESHKTAISVLHIHQPKKPPIPDDACILADYMLMAEYKPQTAVSEGTQLSKGIRLLSCSRDVFWSGAAGGLHGGGMSRHASNYPYGMGFFATGAYHVEYPFFGTHLEGCAEGMNGATTNRLKIDGSLIGSHGGVNGFADKNDLSYMTSASVIGLHPSAMVGTNTGVANRMGFATGIHTSHHYQTFETPFTRDLVGGDRNMEQNNLVVTADGKTWDQVTRDTSYIGNMRVFATTTTNYTTWVSDVILDDWRGAVTTYNNNMNKDFAISYTRIVCLVTGEYRIRIKSYQNVAAGTMAPLEINGVQMGYNHLQPSTTGSTWENTYNLLLKRGDTVQVKGRWHSDPRFSNFTIERIGEV